VFNTAQVLRWAAHENHDEGGTMTAGRDVAQTSERDRRRAGSDMKLLIQPRDGVAPILAAIRKARTRIEVFIFRFDRDDIERALRAAIGRGVQVHALIAHTNRGGAGRLRKLEQRLVGAGATVDRTADDFVRYHGKFMIVDRATLLVFGYNYTRLDIGRSRSFGVVTTNRKTVQDAVTLFEADCARHPYGAPRGAGTEETDGSLVISPVHARAQLSAFITKAKTQLLIYDPKVSDARIIELLTARAKAGVDVRIIGRVGGRGHDLVHQKYPGHRLHVRVIVRDGRRAFIGSQSLRALELDKRREVGVFVKGAAIVKEITATFEADWAQTSAWARPERTARHRSQSR
jgi:phosphatidylserine/phosphatidylglycerophosphate/cardiolipin synthase-like enzyme